MKVQKQITAINEPFWTANGSAVSAELLLAGQPMLDASNIEVTGVQRTDWQGVQPLFKIPRTNLFLYSQALANAYWSKTQCAMTDNSAVAPDGSVTADLVTLAATLTNSYWGYAVSTSNYSGQSRCCSVFLKLGTFTGNFTLALRDGADTTYGGGVFNLGTGAVSSVQGVAGIVPMGNGWFRCWVAAVFPPGSANGLHFYVVPTVTSANVNQTYYAWGEQQEAGMSPTSYIGTAAAAATQTDYAISADQVNFGFTPLAGSTFAWTGTATVEMLSATATILAQYANSPSITALIDFMNQWLDPTTSLDGFYNMIWNVETAQGIGLDIWGAIVDVPRTIQLVPPNTYFGFETTPVMSFYPFNNQPFYAGPAQGTQYTLSDPAYRVLIMTKALANISSFTAASVNALLRYLFAGRGSCYVLEIGPMQIEYVFNFALEPWELSVLAQPQLLPRPAGVGVSIVHS